MGISEELKKSLIDKGIRQVKIANDLSITKGAVSLFVNKPTKEVSARFDNWVREHLGLDLPVMRAEEKTGRDPGGAVKAHSENY